MARRKCLIIDESMMVRRVASRIVRDFGYDVVEAENGADALPLAINQQPDVILIDWRLGDMDGAGFIARLREETPESDRPKILFCTSDRRVERITEALSLGADEYIMKPFDSDIIESKFRLSGLPVTTAKSSGMAATKQAR